MLINLGNRAYALQSKDFIQELLVEVRKLDRVKTLVFFTNNVIIVLFAILITYLVYQLVQYVQGFYLRKNTSISFILSF